LEEKHSQELSRTLSEIRNHPLNYGNLNLLQGSLAIRAPSDANATFAARHTQEPMRSIIPKKQLNKIFISIFVLSFNIHSFIL